MRFQKWARQNDSTKSRGKKAGVVHTLSSFGSTKPAHTDAPSLELHHRVKLACLSIITWQKGTDCLSRCILRLLLPDKTWWIFGRFRLL